MNLYVIRDWELHYEKAQSRQVGRVSWVSLPVKHDGLGFRRLMTRPDGIGMYGAWVLIVQVAAKCTVRGRLADEKGRPLSAGDLSLKTGAPSSVFEEALNLFSSEEIGWLDASNWERADSVPIVSLTGQDSTGQNSTRESAPADAGYPQDLLDWLAWWNRLRDKSLVPCGVDETTPSGAILKAWKRTERLPAVRRMLSDRAAIEEAIEDSGFCREGWFRLEKLFGAKNRDGEYIVRKLLDGGYRNGSQKSSERPMLDPSIFGAPQ